MAGSVKPFVADWAIKSEEINKWPTSPINKGNSLFIEVEFMRCFCLYVYSSDKSNIKTVCLSNNIVHLSIK